MLTPRVSLTGLLLAGSFSLLPVQLWAQTVPETCLVTPAPTCVAALNDRLAELEAAETDPTARARAMKDRSILLANLGYFDEAEALARQIESPKDDPQLRDWTFWTIVSEPDAKAPERARGLLSEIKDNEVWDLARASYLVQVARHAGIDSALTALEETERDGRRLATDGLATLAYLAIQAGEIDLAIRLVKENIGTDPDEVSSMWSDLIYQLAAAGHLDQAESVLAELQDGVWNVVTSLQLANMLVTAGQPERGVELFRQAGGAIRTLQNSGERSTAMSVLVESAANAGQIDLAVNLVTDSGVSPMEIATALSQILYRLPPEAAETTWRPIAESVIAILEAEEGGDAASVEARDWAWQSIAVGFANRGDQARAIELLPRIVEDYGRERAAQIILDGVIAKATFDEALTILPDHSDPDQQAQMLLRLFERATYYKNAEVADKAMETLLEMVEGPKAVKLTDDTISKLADAEARIGRYALAEKRLAMLTDKEEQAFGRITNLHFVVANGTDQDFATYFPIAKQAVAELTDAESKQSLAQYLVASLVQGDRVDEAFVLADQTEDPALRDQLLADLLEGMDTTNLALATQVMSGISNPEMRREYERRYYMYLLDAVDDVE